MKLRGLCGRLAIKLWIIMQILSLVPSATILSLREHAIPLNASDASSRYMGKRTRQRHCLIVADEI